MIKKIILLFCALLLLLATACAGSRDNGKPDGTYRAVDPPQTGEPVVEEITFKDDTLIMTSGSVSREVKYRLGEDTLTIITSFGEFTHSFSQKENSVILDGVEYVK